MIDRTPSRFPPAVSAILEETTAIGFDMVSDSGVGSLLAVFAASKPGGRFLELGTGTGHGAAWMLSGMDAASRLDTVDTDRQVVEVARRHLARDRRITFHLEDAAAVIGRSAPGSYDVIYADAWAGKFTHLDETLALLRAGGLYVVDDLLPQPNWPDGHALKVASLVEALERLSDFRTTRLTWASGVMIAVRAQERYR